MQSVSRALPRVAHRPAARASRLSAGPILFMAALAFYLSAALLLVFRYHAVVPEALSRVGNAYYVLFSRDPHLAAIGFVWNPLPSMLALPLLPLKALWPALAQVGFAGNIVSAIFMAGTVYQAHALLREFGISRPWRLALVALFACQPLLFYLGATGLPQPIFLFFLLHAIRRLGDWVSSRELRPLIAAGAALSGAYLVSAAALGAGVGAFLLVTGLSFHRNRGSDRMLTALCDGLILAFPLALVVLSWTGATWLITGDPFHQLSSVYASGSQIHALAAQPASALPGPRTAPGPGARPPCPRRPGALRTDPLEGSPD